MGQNRLCCMNRPQKGRDVVPIWPCCMEKSLRLSDLQCSHCYKRGPMMTVLDQKWLGFRRKLFVKGIRMFTVLLCSPSGAWESHTTLFRCLEERYRPLLHNAHLCPRSV